MPSHLRAAGAASLLCLLLTAGQALADTPPAVAPLSAGAPSFRPPGEHGLAALSMRLDSAGLERAARRLSVALPLAGAVELEREGLELRGPGDLAWRGRVVGEPDSEVVLTLSNDLVFGRLRLGARVHELRSSRDGSLTVTLLDESSFPRCGVDGPGPALAKSAGPLNEDREFPGAGLGERPQPHEGGCAPVDSAVVIDLLCVYSNEALTWAGGVAEIEALAQASVDSSNSAFINSGLALHYRLVHVAQVNYDTQDDTGLDLDWVGANPTVAALRDAWGADMVAILVDTPGDCGTGYVQRNPGPGFEDRAFQATDVDCAVGNMTYAHEHGHNLGLEHNPEDSSQTPPTASFPWSFGHYEDGVFRTVMSYSAQCTVGCPRTAHFSSPDLLQDGLPVGIASERHNARTAAITGPISAEFRANVVSFTRSPGVVEARVAFDRDDVEEDLATGAVVHDSSDLELVEDGGTGQAVGLRFVGLFIPQGATITAAHVEFVVDETGAGAADVEIRAEASDDARVFDATPGDLSGRTLTAALQSWSIPDWTGVGDLHLSPDLSAIVQELVDRAGWSAGNSIALVITGTGARTAEAFDGEATLAPLLHVEFSSGPTADFEHFVSGLAIDFSDVSTDCDGDIVDWDWDFGDGGDSILADPRHDYAVSGTYTVTLTVTDEDGNIDSIMKDVTPGTGVIDRRIAEGNDDVEESLNSGGVDPDSSDIELVDDTERTRPQVVGLRFIDLDIPVAATIDAAFLVFTVDEIGNGPTNVAIAAEATDDARPFEAVDNDVTTRTLGSESVDWNIAPWDIEGLEHQSPDLTAVVQEVVDRGGWNPGNDMVFVIAGSGERIAEAYEGRPDAAARLHVEYSLCPDQDADGLCDDADNCITAANPGQEDADGDGAGDACDPCPTDPTDSDPDADGVCGSDDNCPDEANPGQADADSDGAGDACDPCPNDPTDSDPDADGICGSDDNCPDDANPDQADGDGDGAGDACDPCPNDPTDSDPDADGVCGSDDNCPDDANAGQEDLDGDELGDACDGDFDGDGQDNASDCAPSDASSWTLPGEAFDLRVTGGLDAQISWQAPASPGSTALLHDLVRSNDPADFSAALCLATDLPITVASDAEPSGPLFVYVARSENSCGTGPDGGRGLPSCP